MNYHINITKKAEEDLSSAYDYIEHTLLNPKAADNLLDRTEQIINSLTFMPQKYPVVDDPVLKVWGIRFISVNNYLVFYTIDDVTSTINIIRFLYGKRNWAHILKNEPSIKNSHQRKDSR